MKTVWDVLYKRKRVDYRRGKDYFNPAIVSPSLRAKKLREQAVDLRSQGKDRAAWHCEIQAEGLERLVPIVEKDEIDEQDRATAAITYHAYCCGLYEQPLQTQEERDSDIADGEAKLWRLVETLREQATILYELGMDREADQIENIAARCEHDAYWLEPDEDFPDPPLPHVVRKDTRLQSFVLSMSIRMKEIFGTPMLGTLATLANVTLDRTDVNADKVREILRARRPRAKKKLSFK